jgi:hypothetical protein
MIGHILSKNETNKDFAFWACFWSASEDGSIKVMESAATGPSKIKEVCTKS